jgi:hypothetical protein
MTRKLATIQKILKLEPIEGADRIEKATILGWHVVVRKGEFKVGDMCVYFEVDSLLPVLPIFDFLEKDGTKTILGEDQKEHTGYRLKTIRLKKQISQGLALPIGSFAGILKIQHIWKEGNDVTEQLGVVKYERYIPQNNTPSSRVPVVFPNWLPVKLGMFIKRNFPKLAIKLWGSHLKPFPPFISKTDEMRLQAVPKVLKRHKDKKFFVTEKLDGSSLTFFHNNGEVGVCSRNIWYPKDITNNFWKAIIALDIEEKFKKLGNYAIQGELVGESIQNNKLLIKGQKVYFFNVYNISTGKYLPYKEFIDFCKELNVPTVPVLDTKFKLKNTVDKMVEYATRKSVINKDVWSEGVVVRPLVECQDEELGRLSFKVVNPEFLLKYGE